MQQQQRQRRKRRQRRQQQETPMCAPSEKKRAIKARCSHPLDRRANKIMMPTLKRRNGAIQQEVQQLANSTHSSFVTPAVNESCAGRSVTFTPPLKHALKSNSCPRVGFMLRPKKCNLLPASGCCRRSYLSVSESNARKEMNGHLHHVIKDDNTKDDNSSICKSPLINTPAPTILLSPPSVMERHCLFKRHASVLYPNFPIPRRLLIPDDIDFHS